MTNIYNMTDTWDDVGVDWAAIKMNVGDVASSAASKIIDLQVDSASQFNVDKDGNATIAGGISAASASFSTPIPLSSGGTNSTSATDARTALAVVGTVELAASGGSNLVGFLQSGTGAVARTVQSKLRDMANVKDFGAVGDGTTDDRAAIALADAAGPFVFTPGNYKIASNITIASNVRFELGAVLVIPTGVTVTFNGHAQAGVHRIFECTGTGAVIISRHRNYVGYPEWWGAIANDISGSVPANNVTAIHAALAALSKVELQASDYYTNASIKITQPNRWLCGAGSLWDGTYGTNATRLMVTDGSTTTLQVGPDANPGTIAQFIQGVKVTGIQVARTTAPVVASSCNSILAQFILEAYFEDVRGDESMNGWMFNGTIHTIVSRCSAKRTSAGTGGADSFKGFYILGTSGIAAGGNASLYISYSHADDTRATKTNSVGFYADGKFTDCFWNNCETVSCTVGMEVNGNGAATNDFGNTDMHIIQPINDAFAVYGLYIHSLGVAGSVDIIAPYCGPASGATAAVQIANAPAAVTVTGGQLVMGAASGCVGIVADTSSGVTVNGTMILECGTTAIVMNVATNCRIMPTIKNKVATGGAAVQLIGACAANIIAPIVMGKASGSSLGVQVVGTTDDRNEYNCTGIDSSCIAGGSANKLTRNGVQITATGLSGTNLVSGVMA